MHGIPYALASYLLWGLLPIYWKLLKQVPAYEILAHRIVWSTVFILGLLLLQGRWFELKDMFNFKRKILFFSPLLLGANWFIYVWAVNASHIVDASLGYFICPLLTVLLGVIFLKERLNLWQIMAVILVLVGVFYSIYQLGSFPWIALSIAITFSLYSLIRKQVKVGPIVGLGWEVLVISPLALGFLLYLAFKGKIFFGNANLKTNFLLIGTGIITTIPLICYIHAVKKIKLTTMGILQYVAPSCQLVVGVLLYQEKFSKDHLIVFGIIWLAILIYSLNSILFRTSPVLAKPVIELPE
ncbi:MAG: EamA family transporter RarD [Pseudomonadota bacterium]